MLTVYPDYYPAFRCTAEKCRHTCCAGWEIDIDPDTRAACGRVGGPLGEKLRRAIDDAPTPHFVLTPEKRCPFLTVDNLCELILETGGESLLCQICRDHPRWRSFLPGRTEVGVGLCCEAAAALILSRTQPVTLVREGEEESGDEDADALLLLRDEVLAAAQDRALPLPARTDEVLALCGASLPFSSLRRWAAFYRGLERLDEGWTALLDRLAEAGDSVDITQTLNDHAVPFEQLLVYFLHRHFLQAYDDGDVTGKAALAVLSVRVLAALYALFPGLGLAELSRMYSAEIEYSDDNLYALYGALACDAPR